MTIAQYVAVAVMAIGVWAFWVLVDVVFDGEPRPDTGKVTKAKGEAKR